MSSRTRFHLLLAILGLWSAVLTCADDQPGAAAYGRAVQVTPLLKAQADGAGQKIVYPSGAPAEITGVLVEIAPGGQTGWHSHPVPCVAYVLEGELSVELAGGETKALKAGEAFVEVVDVLHNGTNPGPKRARLVMFALGTAGQPYAVKAPAPPAR